MVKSAISKIGVFAIRLEFVMRESVKFLNYCLMPDDKIEVEWVRLLPGHINQFLLIIDAGCEPDDRAVRLGILRAAWYEHEAGCVLISRGDLVVKQRFALSEKPLVRSEEQRSAA